MKLLVVQSGIQKIIIKIAMKSLPGLGPPSDSVLSCLIFVA